MKKIKSSIALFLSLLFVFLMCACASGGALSAPTDLSIDDANTLSWSLVRNARSYDIEVVNVESGDRDVKSTRRTYYAIDGFGLSEGDYEIRVMAIGGNQNESQSQWSAPLNFHKEYTTGLVYTLINNGTEYMISKVGTASGAVTIEDEYRGKPVTQIGPAAFRGSGKLESVVIGGNVTTIADNAFFQCAQLASVTIPESVTEIGSAAFQGCNKLTEITIPDSVTEIKEKTFAYCRGLERVTLGKNVETIGDSAFYACSALKSIVFPDSVKVVGQYAFSGTGEMALSSVTFGSGISQIGAYAFQNLNALSEVAFADTEALSVSSYAFSNCDALQSVAFPNGLTYLGGYTFYGSDNLADVTFPETLKYVGSDAFTGTALYAAQEESNQYGGLIYAGDWLVASTKEAKQSTLPDALGTDYFKPGVVGIGVGVFMGAQTIRSVKFPDTVKYVNASAFNNCPNLYSLLTNRSTSELEVIGDSAFANCGHLSNIQLNEKLKEIGSNAFLNCESVQNNTNNPNWVVPDSVEAIGQNAFKGTYLYDYPDDDSGIIYAGNWVVGYSELSSSDVTLRTGTKGIADWAFKECAELRSVYGLQNVEHLGNGAFYKCTNLSYISSLYRYLEYIGPYTFYKCSSLFSVEFPSELKEIGFAAFGYCETLNKIDLSESLVTAIGDAAFWECFNVETILLGDYVETIGSYAFIHLEKITELETPDSLREIGERAFSGCYNLSSVRFGNGLETIGDFAFRYCFSSTDGATLTIPDSVKYIGDYAFYGSYGIGELNLGSGVEHIGMCAFYGIGELTTLTIPASVSYIGDYAFMYCTSLRSLVFRDKIDYIGMNAFYGCALATVYANFNSVDAAAWNVLWNSSYRPVIWNAVISEDGYVTSVTVNGDTFTNAHSTATVAGPHRSGYKFLGWSTDPNATEAEYAATDIRDVEYGTTLYAVWEKLSDEEPDAGQETYPPEDPSGESDGTEYYAILREYGSEI